MAKKVDKIEKKIEELFEEELQGIDLPSEQDMDEAYKRVMERMKEIMGKV